MICSPVRFVAWRNLLEERMGGNQHVHVPDWTPLCFQRRPELTVNPRRLRRPVNDPDKIEKFPKSFPSTTRNDGPIVRSRVAPPARVTLSYSGQPIAMHLLKNASRCKAPPDREVITIYTMPASVVEVRKQQNGVYSSYFQKGGSLARGACVSFAGPSLEGGTNYEASMGSCGSARSGDDCCR